MDEIAHIKDQIQQLHKRVEIMEDWKKDRDDIILGGLMEQLADIKEQLSGMYGEYRRKDNSRHPQD